MTPNRKTQVLQWSSQSLELVLIEMLWHDFKQAVHAWKLHLSSIAELKQFC